MDNFYLWIILAVAVVLLVFMWRKASKTSKEHYRRQEELKQQLIHQAELKRDFEELTREKIENTPDEKLLEGAAACVQFHLERHIDMEERFEQLPLSCKYIYTLEYLTEDTKDGLYEFFKKNGEPLTGLAAAAAGEVFKNERLTDIIRTEYSMSDDNNEEVSVDSDEILRLDGEFAEIMKSVDVCGLSAKYIREHCEDFLNFKD